MLHPLSQLAPTYAAQWASMKVTREGEALETAERLLKDRKTYDEIAGETGVPTVWLMATNEREDGGRLDRYFGNGDVLTRPTTDVPRHRGPFASFKAGVLDSLHYDGIDAGFRAQLRAGIAIVPLMIFEETNWNGWGYDAHGIRTPYVFGATNLQQRGKYDADGHWNGALMDTQLGTAAIWWALLKLAPDIAPAGMTLPAGDVDDADLPAHSPPPITVGGSHHDAEWLQAALNKVATSSLSMRVALVNAGAPPQLAVDGSVGRQTRMFVRALEISQGLAIDRGYPGPQVLGALDKILGTGWQPPAA